MVCITIFYTDENLIYIHNATTASIIAATHNPIITP